MVDECDDANFTNAANIFRTLDTSASTRFGKKRKVMTISFRRYVGSSGMIRTLYHEFKHRELTTGTAYARRYPSYVFNNKPGLEESLEEFKNTKPEEYACMIESTDAEGSHDSFIRDAARIETSMRLENRTWIFDMPIPPENWRNLGNAEYVWEKDGQEYTLDPYDFPIAKKGIPGVKYVLAGDPALGSIAGGGDGYGLTLAHRELVKGKDGKMYPRPVIDFCFRFTGRMFPEGEVQMEAVHKLIEKLNNYGYNIGIYSFDGWNSAATTQWIVKNYPSKIVYNRNLVETRDYTALKDAIFSHVPPSSGVGEPIVGGGISWFYHPILAFEIKELRIDKEKGRIDHTDTSSKDIADTVAKCVRIITLQWPFVDIGLSGNIETDKNTLSGTLGLAKSTNDLAPKKKKIVIPKKK